MTQLGLASLFVFFFIFPDGRFVPRWSRWVVPLFFVMPVLFVLFPDSILVEPPPRVNILLFLGLWACAALAQVYRYRRVSGPVERQQTKWVVFGVTACVALLIGFLLPVRFLPRARRGRAWLSLVSNLAGLTVAGSFGLLLIPISIGAAILRYRLYDIDVIINRALVYATANADARAHLLRKRRAAAVPPPFADRPGGATDDRRLHPGYRRAVPTLEKAHPEHH